MGSNGSTQNEMKNKECSKSYAKAAKVATWPADKKTMKAPGREGTRMYRNDFEDNPKSYFQKLRHDDQKNKECSKSYAKAAKVATWPADKKTMKAPGREGTRMYRNDFEDNPKRYFQKLRHDDQKNKECSKSYAKAAKVATWPADKKTMKAPGREGTRMYRNDFENNPKRYFQKLRHDDQKRKHST